MDEKPVHVHIDGGALGDGEKWIVTEHVRDGERTYVAEKCKDMPAWGAWLIVGIIVLLWIIVAINN
jgi:hypothetical protein